MNAGKEAHEEPRDMDEDEMAAEIAGLLWNSMEQNGWKSVEDCLGDVTIITNSGVTYRFTVERE